MDLFSQSQLRSQITSNKTIERLKMNKITKRCLEQEANGFLRATYTEAKVTWNLLKGNISFTLVTGLFCVASSLTAFSFKHPEVQISPVSSCLLLFKAVLWFLCFGYVLDIANQITGVKEDLLNAVSNPKKASRPLGSSG